MANYSKYPVERPVIGRKVLVKHGLRVLEGIATDSPSCGVCIMINGKTYDSNRTLYWRYPTKD